MPIPPPAGSTYSASTGRLVIPTSAGQGVKVFDKVTGRLLGIAFPEPARIDLLAITNAQKDQVMSLTFTDCDASPTASPSWSRPGMFFDGKASDGKNRHYYCSITTYSTGQGGTGTGPAWHCFQKLN